MLKSRHSMADFGRPGLQAAHIAAKGRVERENHDVRKAMMRAEKAEDRQTR